MFVLYNQHHHTEPKIGGHGLTKINVSNQFSGQQHNREIRVAREVYKTSIVIICNVRNGLFAYIYTRICVYRNDILISKVYRRGAVCVCIEEYNHVLELR